MLNLVLLVFNVLPIYPLDGGQMAYALLWFVVGQGSALSVMSFLGVVIGVGLCAFDFSRFGLLGIFIAIWAAAGLVRGIALSRPGSGALRNSLTLLENRRFADAVRGCTQAIGQIRDYAGERAAAHLFRGTAALALGDLQRALADHDAAMGLVPSSCVYLARGITRLAREEAEPAVEDLTAVVGLKPEMAAALTFRGLAHLKRGEWEQAEADGCAALRLDGNDALAYLVRATARGRLGQPESATADFEAALRLAPELAARAGDGTVCLTPEEFSAVLVRNAGNALLELTLGLNRQGRNDPVRQAQDQQKLEEGIARFFLPVLHFLVWLRPRSARLRLERSEFYKAVGEWKKAAEDLEEAILFAPNNFAVENNLAWLFAACPDAELRDGPRALALARQASERSEWKNANVLDTLAAACAAVGDFGEAVKWQKAALEDSRFRAKHEAKALERLQLYQDGGIVPRIDPGYAYAAVCFERGNAHVDGGEMDLAIADYTEAIRLDPEYASAYGNRGEAYRRKGDLEQALADLNHALQLDTSLCNALNSRGIVFKNQGKYDRSIADFTESIRLNPRPAMAFANRGMAYKAKGEFHKAIADYEVAMRVDPTYMNAPNNLAWLLATCPRSEIRDGKKALELAKRACELTGWRRAECLGTLGAAYAEIGNFEGAHHWQEKALEFPEYRLRDQAKAEMRLQLYRDGKPFRDEASPESADAPIPPKGGEQ